MLGLLLKHCLQIRNPLIHSLVDLWLLSDTDTLRKKQIALHFTGGVEGKKWPVLNAFLSLLYEDKVHIEYILQVKFMHEFETTGLIFSDALYILSKNATIRLLKKQHNESVMTDVQYH